MRAVTLGADGDVWAISDSGPLLRHYDSHGELIGAFERREGGDSDVVNPWSIIPGVDSTTPVRVWDVARRRLVSFGRNGRVRRVLTINTSNGLVRGDILELSYGTPRRLAALDDGYVIEDEPRGVSFTADLASIVLLHLGRSGAVQDTLVDLTGSSHLTGNEAGAIAFVSVPLWTTCGARSLVLFDPAAHMLRRWSSAGHTVDSASVELSTRRISDRDIKRYLQFDASYEWRLGSVRLSKDSGDALVKEALRDRRGLFSTRTPPAVAVLCDSAGEVWLERFSTDTDPRGFGTLWYVVVNGRVARVVAMPDGFRPTLIANREIIGIVTTHSGKYVGSVPEPLPWPPPA